MSRSAIDKIIDGVCTLVIDNGGVEHLFGGRGVKDLFELLSHRPQLLAGAEVTDKIVGKGAAALMLLGGVKSLHAIVISEGALSLLSGTNVEVSYSHRVPNIINRSGTGICPVEQLCRDCSSAQECLPLIRDFLSGD